VVISSIPHALDVNIKKLKNNNTFYNNSVLYEYQLLSMCDDI